MKRHIGKIRNTDRRCVVVYMQLPELPEYALVIDTDSLPDQFHEWVIAVVDSQEGQSATTLATVLHRRPSPDNGIDLLTSLHRRAFLQRQKIDNILMIPHPSVVMPLRDIIEQNGGTVGPKNQATSAAQANNQPTPLNEEAANPGFNRFAEGRYANDQANNEGMALSILRQAALIETEAKNKREEAYRMAPHLRPVVAPPMATAPVAPAPAPVAPVFDHTSAPLPVLVDDSVDSAAIALAEQYMDRAAYREDNPQANQTVVDADSGEVLKKSRGRPRKVGGE